MSIEALKEQARNHEQNEDWVKALQAYEEAIRRQTDDDQPDLGLYNRAGDLSTRLADPIGAIGHYERAVDLYLESELPNNAIAILKKILRNLPDRAEVYLRMGQIRASQGFFTDARGNFLIYAEAMQQAGEMEEAFRALAEFADLAPEDVDIRLTLAEQFQAHDKPSEALEQLFRAHQTLSIRGDETGAIEERIFALDANAVIPEPSVHPAGGYGGGGQSAPVLADDDAVEGEIAFVGNLDHGGSDADLGVDGQPDAHEDSADGLWAEAALPSEPTTEIELDDELALADEVFSEADEESTASVPEAAEATLESAYIDFDAVSEAEEPDEDEIAVPSMDDDTAVQSDAADAQAELETEIDGGWQTDESAESDESDESNESESTWELSSDTAEVHDAAEVALAAPEYEEVAEKSTSDVAEAWGEAPAWGETADDDLDDAPDDTLGEAFADGADDGLEEDIGGELPLLSFDDDAADGEVAGQPEETAVAVESAEDETSEFESAAEDDEWVGLDDGPERTGGVSSGSESWSTGTEFELEAVEFQSLDEDELREYVEANPSSGPAWEQMGRLVVARGDQESATEAFQAAHAAYAENRDFHSAMRSVRELLLIDPDSPTHHQRLVEYAHRGDDRTLLVAAFLELGDCLQRTGAPEKSDAVYQKVLDIDPANFRARSALGLADDSEAAVGAGSDYVDLGSMVLDKREKTTRWTVETQEPTTEEDFDFGDMLKQFRSKVADHLDHDDVQAHYDLGTAYKEMGLLDEAISEFQQALRADGQNLATFEVLGQTFMEQGQPEAAIRTLTRATGMPFDVEDELLGIYYYLGRAFEELGNRDEALEYYEKVFALDINFEDVTERLRSLR